MDTKNPSELSTNWVLGALEEPAFQIRRIGTAKRHNSMTDIPSTTPDMLAPQSPPRAYSISGDQCIWHDTHVSPPFDDVLKGDEELEQSGLVEDEPTISLATPFDVGDLSITRSLLPEDGVTGQPRVRLPCPPQEEIITDIKDWLESMYNRALTGLSAEDRENLLWQPAKAKKARSGVKGKGRGFLNRVEAVTEQISFWY